MPPESQTPSEQPMEVQNPTVTTQEGLEALIDSTLGIQSKPATKEEPQPDDTATTPSDNAEGEGINQEVSSEEPTPEEPQATPEQKPEPEPEPIEQPEAPSIEVEDAEGNKFTIRNVNDIPEDFVPKNNRQVFEILDQLNDLKQQEKENATKAAENAARKDAEEKRQAQINAWDAEVDELITLGMLDKPKAQPGTDAFLKDPAIQKIQSVFKFMGEQNEQRTKENKQPIGTFSLALNMYQKVEDEKAKQAAIKQENQEAKIKASLIGGNSSTGAAQASVYKAGQYRSIDEIPV